MIGSFIKGIALGAVIAMIAGGALYLIAWSIWVGPS